MESISGNVRGLKNDFGGRISGIDGTCHQQQRRGAPSEPNPVRICHTHTEVQTAVLKASGGDIYHAFRVPVFWGGGFRNTARVPGALKMSFSTVVAPVDPTRKSPDGEFLVLLFYPNMGQYGSISALFQ